MLYTSGLRESGKLVFRNPGWHGPVHMCGFQCLLTPGESQCYHMPPPFMHMVRLRHLPLMFETQSPHTHHHQFLTGTEFLLLLGGSGAVLFNCSNPK